ncbi:MAG: hypothetical protein CFH01_01965 [Alphaproteobacteria bacterium MarineAlpha2_Bin1]|nr:MAG: hypothetical protein CFH01_01965 [Alphaproteobacteria bacterium MarineAlpha2_Bin1]|tara:strand:+ start:969 stop:1412 length:444 start_codon:yes stop_codon:yes gene_type:complete
MIFIRKKIIEKIKKEAKYIFPNECCGFLSGLKNKNIYMIDDYHSCKNISRKPAQEFRIDPIYQIKLQKKLRTISKNILGIYHSHPNGNINLSKKDIYFFNDINLLWFIIALSKKKYSNILVYMKKNNVNDEFLTCEYHIKNEKFFKR